MESFLQEDGDFRCGDVLVDASDGGGGGLVDVCEGGGLLLCEVAVYAGGGALTNGWGGKLWSVLTRDIEEKETYCDQI